MHSNAASRRLVRVFLILLLVLTVFSVFSSLFSFAEPIVVEEGDGVSILVKALPGTVEGAKELKESGELVSMSLENEISVKVFTSNLLTRIRLSYTADNGKAEDFPGDSFVYRCKSDDDYTTLHIVVYNEKDEALKDFRVTLVYREEGAFKRFFWRIAGNETVREVFTVLKNEMPLAVWETFYVTLLSSFISFLIGLPLGVLLVAGDKNGIRPLPRFFMSALNVVINLLRSIPFLILMILVIPVSRAIVGTSVGTVATIVPLVFAAFPFVARLVESSLREINPNIIEAAQSMGASPFQIIARVMIPESIPSLVSNMTIALTTILGYSAMSGAIGGGGLGQIAISYGYYRYMFPTMVVAVVLLVLLVQIFQSVGTRAAKKLDKRLK